MLIALDVHMIDRRRGRVQVEDGRTLRIGAAGDHHGRSCPTIEARHMVALDFDGGAYAVDVLGMVACPLGASVSSILRKVQSDATPGQPNNLQEKFD